MRSRQRSKLFGSPPQLRTVRGHRLGRPARAGAPFGRVLGLVAALAAVTVGGTVDAAGQAVVPPTIPPVTQAPPVTPVPPVTPEPDPTPRIRVALARLDVLEARAALLEQQESATGAYDTQAQAQADLDRAVEEQSFADGQLSAAQDQVGLTAMYAYMQASGGVSAAELQGTSTAAGEERELLGASIDHHQQLVRDARAAVDVARTAVGVAEQALAAAQETAAEHHDRVSAASGELLDARRELRTATEDEAGPPTSDRWALAIEGPSAFTAHELVEWYEAQGHGSQATVPIGELVRAFLDNGEAEGVRGDMAFAQSIHETGWFANNDTIHANNFAGIGHCDSCAAGYPYPTADLGVLAQIQLLESYADDDPVYELPRADPGLDGPSGCCPTWADLGGVWATDTGYGPRILGRYAEMLEWLVAARTARAGLSPGPP